MRTISDKFEKAIRKEILARSSIKRRILVTLSRSKTNLVIFVCAVSTLALFIVAALLQNRGMFTITMPTFDMIQYSVVLSESKEFLISKHELRADPYIDMDNIDFRNDVNVEKAREIDGSGNENNYIAYTFYIKNNGEKDVEYDAVLKVDEVYNQTDEIIRILVYRNDERFLFKKNDTLTLDEGAQKAALEEIDTDSVPFRTNVVAGEFDRRGLSVSDFDKYTVIVWIEGNDPDTTNDRLGGSIRMSMEFRVFPILDDTEGEEV